MPMEIIAIRRDPSFSPGNRENDTAILEQCAEELRARGHLVTVHDEKQAGAWGGKNTPVLHMARGRVALDALARMEKRGLPVVNSVAALDRCARQIAYHTMVEHGIPCPESRTIGTGGHADAAPPFPALWLKRTDSCTQSPEDVIFSSDAPSYRSALQRFFERGIAEVQASAHLEGVHVKFYGVTPGRFFHSFAPATDPCGRSPLYDAAALERIAAAAAEAMRLRVWGGDAIVASDGTLAVIDMNDFPSFRPCREAAAKAIADCLVDSIQNRKEKP